MRIKQDILKSIPIMIIIFQYCSPESNINYLSDSKNYLLEEKNAIEALKNNEPGKLLQYFDKKVIFDIEDKEYVFDFEKEKDGLDFVQKKSVAYKFIFDMSNKKTQRELSDLINKNPKPFISRCWSFGKTIESNEKKFEDKIISINIVDNWDKGNSIYRIWELVGPDLDRADRGGTCSFNIYWKCEIKSKTCLIVKIKIESSLPIH